MGPSLPCSYLSASTMLTLTSPMRCQELQDKGSVFQVMSNAALRSETEKAAVRLVLVKLSEVAARFSSSLEEDEAALATALTESARLILSFRVAKKQTLARVQGLMEGIARRQSGAPRKSALAVAKERHGAAWATMDDEAKRSALAVIVAEQHAQTQAPEPAAL